MEFTVPILLKQFQTKTNALSNFVVLLFSLSTLFVNKEVELYFLWSFGQPFYHGVEAIKLSGK